MTHAIYLPHISERLKGIQSNKKLREKQQEKEICTV